MEALAKVRTLAGYHNGRRVARDVLGLHNLAFRQLSLTSG